VPPCCIQAWFADWEQIRDLYYVTFFILPMYILACVSSIWEYIISAWFRNILLMSFGYVASVDNLCAVAAAILYSHSHRKQGRPRRRWTDEIKDRTGLWIATCVWAARDRRLWRKQVWKQQLWPSTLRPSAHAPETGSRNWRHKLDTQFWCQFFVPMHDF